MTIFQTKIEYGVNVIFSDKRVAAWLQRFMSAVDKTVRVTAVGAVMKTNNELYSVLLEVEFIHNGIPFVRSILIRGPAVVVVVALFSDRLEDSKFLVVRQIRVCNGLESYEFPSGGSDSDDPILSVLRELREETGICIERNRVVLLRSNLIVCESAMDEIAEWYVVDIKPHEIKIGDFGIASENERTRTEVITWSQLVGVNSFHMVTAKNLIEELFLANKSKMFLQ